MTTHGTGRSSKDQGAVVHLSVHPDVVFKLGADLITDDVQALVELVKNSYDADSADVSIEVDSEVMTNPMTGEVVSAPLGEGGVGANDPVQGLIRVTDRGTGMTARTIRTGWLTVSASAKREMKRLGKVTEKGRTPLGDKGLGRLGAQRLGDIVEIATRPEGEKVENSVRIRWSDFSKVDSLDDVDLILETKPSSKRSGTTLTIRSLRDPAHWHETVTDLEQKLSAMVSPYGNRGFDVHLKVNGQARDLRQRHEQVRRAAQIRYALSYADGFLTMHGRIAVSYFRPSNKAEIPAYRQLVEHDNGAALRSWILNSSTKRAAGVGLTAGDEQYFIEVSRTVALRDLDEILNDEDGPIDPGPFAGEVDYVPLRTDEFDVFNSGADYRDFVGDISGIRIYRDGFGVRLDKDWVGLGNRWSTGTSFYNLRPENVVGYIDLTARENSQLVETTNREGFQDTPAFRNFLRLMEAWRAFTEDSQGLVRRAWGDFRKVQATDVVSDRPMTTEAITQRAETRRTQLSKGTKAARGVQETLQATQRELEDASVETLLETPELSGAKRLLAQAVHDANELSDGLSSLEREYQDAVKELDALSSQLTTVHEQLTDTWEAVSLGITAESLSHEIHQIADRLRARSQQTSRYLRDKKIDDLQVHTFVEHVRSSAAALNRQVAHLDPALRFMRERRSKLNLSAVSQAVAAHYNDIWATQQISVAVAVESDFTVEMNEGRLTQVLDNLLLNSGYWLLEQQRQNKAASGEVQIKVRSPYVTVTDTGPGIDPALEELIFEPFVTAKRKGRGRGLGLFVVRQLLDSEAATIDLDPSHDPDGRRRTFRLTFENAKRVK